MENPIPKRWAGAWGILGPSIAFFFIALSIQLNPWFSWPDNALSDLGAIGESYNYVYNLGMVLSGIGGALFSTGLPRLTNNKIGLAGTAVFGAGMLSLALVGVFPSGTSPHVTVSLAFFGLATLGITIVGVDQLFDENTGPWGAFSMSIVVLGVASVVLIETIPYGLGAAIPEMIGAVAISEFSICFGARLIKGG